MKETIILLITCFCIVIITISVTVLQSKPEYENCVFLKTKDGNECNIFYDTKEDETKVINALQDIVISYDTTVLKNPLMRLLIQDDLETQYKLSVKITHIYL